MKYELFPGIMLCTDTNKKPIVRALGGYHVVHRHIKKQKNRKSQCPSTFPP